MKIFVAIALCALSAPALADPAFDKDVAYCAGLSASLLSINPENVAIQNAVTQLAQLVEENQSTMDVDESRQTAQAYTIAIQQVRGRVPDQENEQLAVLVDMGLKSCKRVGVVLFPE